MPPVSLCSVRDKLYAVAPPLHAKHLSSTQRVHGTASDLPQCVPWFHHACIPYTAVPLHLWLDHIGFHAARQPLLGA
jgi:hypothetical protein